MAEFLTTSGIAHYLEQVIKKAEETIYIISPYLNLSPIFLQRLIDADHSGKTINIVYRNDKLSDNERRKLKKLKNLNLYHYDTLHAKAYANEKFVIITSMNVIEYSEKKNREMGVLFHLDSDKELFAEALDEILSIVGSSDVLRIQEENKPEVNVTESSSNLSSTESEIKNIFSYALRIPISDFSINTSFKALGLDRGLDPENYWDSDDEWEKVDMVEEILDGVCEKYRIVIELENFNRIRNVKELANEIDKQIMETVESFKNKQIGYCIRDGIMIPFDSKMPFCERAYKSWNRYKNPNYKENYCHKTGKPSDGKTSHKNPILK